MAIGDKTFVASEQGQIEIKQGIQEVKEDIVALDGVVRSNSGTITGSDGKQYQPITKTTYDYENLALTNVEHILYVQDEYVYHTVTYSDKNYIHKQNMYTGEVVKRTYMGGNYVIIKHVDEVSNNEDYLPTQSYHNGRFYFTVLLNSNTNYLYLGWYDLSSDTITIMSNRNIAPHYSKGAGVYVQGDKLVVGIRGDMEVATFDGSAGSAVIFDLSASDGIPVYVTTVYRKNPANAPVNPSQQSYFLYSRIATYDDYFLITCNIAGSIYVLKFSYTGVLLASSPSIHMVNSGYLLYKANDSCVILRHPTSGQASAFNSVSLTHYRSMYIGGSNFILSIIRGNRIFVTAPTVRARAEHTSTAYTSNLVQYNVFSGDLFTINIDASGVFENSGYFTLDKQLYKLIKISPYKFIGIISNDSNAYANPSNRFVSGNTVLLDFDKKIIEYKEVT